MSQPQDDILTPIDGRAVRFQLSVSGIIVGLLVGVLVGIFYAWQIDPSTVRDTSPADLNDAQRQLYVEAIGREYAITNDLQLAVVRLVEVAPDDDPFELAAAVTCDVIRSGRVTDTNDIEMVRSLRSIFEPQGVQANCDVAAFNTSVPVTIVLPSPTITFTPSITPVASKTPTQAIAAAPINTPLPTDEFVSSTDATYRESFVENYCDPNNAGVLEVYVRDTDGSSLPGVAIQVTWDTQEQAVFYSGLKPERGDDYADFDMEAGETYRVAVLDEGQPSRQLTASVCDEAGTIISYRVVLQRFFN